MIPPLPVRPLKVTLPKPQSRLSAFFLGLGAMVLAGGIGWLAVPGLVADWPLVGNAEPATQARFVSGRCRGKLVLHFCDITYDRRGPAGTVREESHIGFFEFHVGSRSVRLMQQKGDPSRVSSDIALDMYWNRLATAGLFIALFGGGGLVLLGQALRGKPDPNARFRRLDGRLLQPVPVDLLGTEAQDKTTWTWRFQPRGKGPPLAPTFMQALPVGTFPFLMDVEGRTALAVTDAAGKDIMLLDMPLSVLDLTPAERAALHAWREAVAAPDSSAA
jgi:hypothetical protein